MTLRKDQPISVGPVRMLWVQSQMVEEERRQDLGYRKGAADVACPDGMNHLQDLNAESLSSPGKACHQLLRVIVHAHALLPW
jgi:hypothetical protein